MGDATAEDTSKHLPGAELGETDIHRENNVTLEAIPKGPQDATAAMNLVSAVILKDRAREDETKSNTTEVTTEEDEINNNIDASDAEVKPEPVISSTKRSRPVYKYDPNKITLRFLFANRDGLTVTIECEPSDTVGEVKGALLSVWPEDFPACSGGEKLRLVCMGKGLLMPDSRTLEDCQIPIFKTHPTPVNVSVKPEDMKDHIDHDAGKKEKMKVAGSATTQAAGPGSQASGATRSGGNASGPAGATTVDQGCACIIL